MKRAILIPAVVSLTFLFLTASGDGARGTDFPVLRGPFLGQTPPGDRAKVFSPGVFSTGHIEKSAVFSPRGDEFYFSVLGDSVCFIAVSRLENGVWTRPIIPRFSRDFLNLHCCLSPDGKNLYFSSENRPRQKRRAPTDKGDIWVVSREAGEWSEPRDLGSSVNSDSSEFYPSVTRDGDLYFYRRGHGGKDDWDIFVSHFDDGVYKTAQRLAETVNTSHNEFDPFIAPDQSFLIFASVGRSDSLGGSDLYISFRNRDGSWELAKNLGPRINSDRWEFCPNVTPDGKYLFFASNRRFLPFKPGEVVTFEQKMAMLDRELTSPGNGHSDFYWIDADVAAGLRSSEKQKIPMLFASYMVTEGQIQQSLMLCESIRTFAGDLRTAPIQIYYLESLSTAVETYRGEFEKLSVGLRPFRMPKRARRFPFGWKPFVAAQAENDAAELAEILVYLDANIILIDEPKDFLMPGGGILAYRPVMHQNIGSLYSAKPDSFWARIYQMLNIPDEALFPMKTIADDKVLRPYFNAGLLALRPEAGVLREWAADFKLLYDDPFISDMCKNEKYKIFLHQAALVGAVLHRVGRDKMTLLPFAYNYPLFFDKFYGSEIIFDSLADVVSMKFEFDFKALPADWDKKLKGRPDVVAWLLGQLKASGEISAKNKKENRR